METATPIFLLAPWAPQLRRIAGAGPLSHLYNNLTIADMNQDHRPDLVLNDSVGGATQNRAQLQVLTIQATSVTGQSQTVHSIQSILAARGK
jgi:hypothetical protein